MNLKARYLFLDDRMRLEIHPPGKEPQAFTLSRRQWLKFIRAVGVGDLPPQQVPPLKPEGKPNQEEAPAQVVRALNLEREQGGLRVSFILDKAKMGLLLPNEGLPEIGEMFFRQAERAGWDPAAGLERLKAGEMTQETLNKAKAN